MQTLFDGYSNFSKSPEGRQGTKGRRGQCTTHKGITIAQALGLDKNEHQAVSSTELSRANKLVNSTVGEAKEAMIIMPKFQEIQSTDNEYVNSQ